MGKCVGVWGEMQGDVREGMGVLGVFKKVNRGVGKYVGVWVR